MNKYQESYNNVKKACTVPFLGKRPIDVCGLSLNRLKELVERATPKKIIIKCVIDRAYYRCPVCRKLILDDEMASNMSKELLKKDNAYCPSCGQALDWSDKK